LLHFQNFDRYARVGKVHGDTATHRARTNHRHRFNRTQHHIITNIGNFACCAFTHKCVA
jgi:hypothetical protein